MSLGDSFGKYPDYWDTVAKSHELRVQRYWFFWWAIAWRHPKSIWERALGPNAAGNKWRPIMAFWRKDTATAALVRLMLRGHNVQL